MTVMDILNYVKDEMLESIPSAKEMKKSDRQANKLCLELYREKGDRGEIFSIR